MSPCDLCGGRIDHQRAEHVRYNNMPLCEDCLEQAVIDDGKRARECEGCAELYHESWLRANGAGPQATGGVDRDGRPIFTSPNPNLGVGALLCPTCRQADVHHEIRERAKALEKAREAAEAAAEQAAAEHAIEVVRRSIRALSEAD